MRPSPLPTGVEGGRALAGFALTLMLILAIGGPSIAKAQEATPADAQPASADEAPKPSAGEGASARVSEWIEQSRTRIATANQQFQEWRTVAPRWQKYCWYAMAGFSALGIWAILDRLWVLRLRRVRGKDFLRRFQKMVEGPTPRFDRAQLVELCAQRKSPASNIVMAAIMRWRGAQADVERATGIAYREEAEKLRRRLILLKRVAVMIPLFGLLCGLLMVNQVLSHATLEKPAMAKDFAPALRPLIVGVIASIIASFFQGAFFAKSARLTSMLDRLGDQAVDAVMLASAHETDDGPEFKGPPRNAKGLRIEIPDEVIASAGAGADVSPVAARAIRR